MTDPRVRYEIVEVDPRNLTLLDNNARYMTRDQFNRLVANIRRDGALTSTPLVYPENDGLTVVSGNHRTKAAIVAELPTIHVMKVVTDLSRDEFVSLQLSHNAITGQDDPHKLRELYDAIEDLDLREYSGLDDATLNLLADVDTPPLASVSLDMRTVTLIMLPEQLEAAERALDMAAGLVPRGGERWIARMADFDALLDSLDVAAKLAGGRNQAIALSIILDTFERHVGEWAEHAVADPPPSPWVPTPALVGWDIPADAARIFRQAVTRMLDHQEITHPWQALELLAADYLAGAD